METEGMDADAVGRTNRLAGETSPYLLQHAATPVDWYPWGEEALERSRREDRPILLSIGYAACHWCHVMAHESFEDDATAAVMNANFVCVKVDREERPDLDGIYMDALQAMTGSGGWPMTVFLTPAGVPFFAGTYFPKEDRLGMTAFVTVLDAVAEAWRSQRDVADEQGRRVLEALSRGALTPESAEPASEETLRGSFEALQESFDPEWGGFGGAPKFPQPMALEFLLRCHLRGYEGALDIVRHTLDRMADGGIFDQVGGGFHRYSVDARWHVPHFEKMLYDNAQLARLYARAWLVTDDERYATIARRTLDYLMREMRHPGGGFFSSQDADSEGVEGKFSVWSWDEIAGLAGAPVARYFGAVRQGNWEGTNVLWRPRPPEVVAEEAGIAVDELLALVEPALAALFEARERRPHPGTDDKVLAAWNGLAIAAFAEAGRIFGEPRYVEAAERAARFVLDRLRPEGGRLLRSWRDERAGGPGYVDDHALLAEACLTLYETTFDAAWFRAARALADDLIRLFRDEDAGGFFQTGSDAEPLVIRPKELFDNAVPAGNSVAAGVLQRIGLITGEASYERAAASALRLVHEYLRRAPTGFGEALCALDLSLSAPKEVAIVGDPESDGTARLIGAVRSRFRPNLVVAASSPGDADAAEAVPLLRGRPAVDGAATAYVCERFVCRLPVTDPAGLEAQLATG
jgi:uncharacterized protein YyaL (SSP411 family)